MAMEPPATSVGPPDTIIELNHEGQIVRKYQKGKFLGKGGFAKCYEVTDCDSGRISAAKVIDKKILVKPKTQAKLRSEIKIHSMLNHKHIVHFERYFEDESFVYIILEICSQQTLMELQRRKKQLSEVEAQYIMLQTLDAVKYMHKNSIIHRDLKLGNLFLNENLDLKIGDFGLAAEVEFGERKRTICGTPNYIAPEILDGKCGHSFEVDVWSLGVILYTLLVGKPPFETSNVKTTYKKIKTVNYSFPETLHISSTARHLIRRILQSQPEHRPSLADIEADAFFATAPPNLVMNPPWTLYPPHHSQFLLKRAESEALRDPLKSLPVGHNYNATFTSMARDPKKTNPWDHNKENYENGAVPQVLDGYGTSVQRGAMGSPRPQAKEAIQHPFSVASHATLVGYKGNEFASSGGSPQYPAAQAVSSPNQNQNGLAHASWYGTSSSPNLAPPQLQSQVGFTAAEVYSPVSSPSLGTNPDGAASHPYAACLPHTSTKPRSPPTHPNYSSAPIQTPPHAPSGQASTAYDHQEALSTHVGPVQQALFGVPCESQPRAIVDAHVRTPSPHNPHPTSSTPASVSRPAGYSSPYTSSSSPLAAGTAVYQSATAAMAAGVRRGRTSPAGHYVDQTMAKDFKRHCHMESPAISATRALAQAAEAPGPQEAFAPRLAAAFDDEDDEDDKCNLTNMHQQLEQSFALRESCKQTDMDDGFYLQGMELPGPSAWVSEYADFSSKYGLAYKFSNGCIGVRFNDSTHMIWNWLTGDVEYISRSKEEGRTHDNRLCFSMEEPPEGLTKKITLIKYFKCYLQKAKGRKEGVEVVVCNDKQSLMEDAPKRNEPLMFVKRWLKTKHAIIFRLSNKSVQVSFFDKTEIILSSEERVVTYTDHAGIRVTFSLQTMARPPPEIAKRLKYMKDILFQLIHK
mmetsp:Transcript_109011/g.188733  ORF Transcript_109011/g.188733 Transcript_109011/m.188733 type:complete len:915 (-) Transcript_109011:2719-5463(-)